tara:strand:- start:16194 stop:17114 length:921 start_codon:yes stop_codon:yes gene_type:complete
MISFISFQCSKAICLCIFFVTAIACLNDINKSENIIHGYLLNIQSKKTDVIASFSILVLMLILISVRVAFTLLSIFSKRCRIHLANDFEAVFSHTFHSITYLLINKKATLESFVLTIFVNLAAFELLSYYNAKEKNGGILVIVSYVLLILPLQMGEIIGSSNSREIILCSSITWSIVTLLYFLHFVALKNIAIYKNNYSKQIPKQLVSTYILSIHIFSTDVILLLEIMLQHGYDVWHTYAIISLIISWLMIVLLIKFIINIANSSKLSKKEKEEIAHINNSIETVHLMNKSSEEEVDLGIEIDNKI